MQTTLFSGPKPLSAVETPSLLFQGLRALTLSLVLGLSVRGADSPELKFDNGPLSRDTKLATSVAGIIKRVSPSVVNIYTSKNVKESDRGANPFFFWHPFFDDGGQDEDTPSRRPRSRQEQSLGSGVIVTEDGYILTNNHVVEGADEIKVALADGKREFIAKVVGKDPQTDVAVLKIEATGLPALTIADSDKVEVGDLALAIGNPFGVGQTVTMGIVSAIGRGGFGIADYEDFIQTDASINPGNSGGALIDADGRLVGINTWIMSRTGGNQGIGFAIPANMARGSMERLIKDGKVVRGYLGVLLQPEITPDLAKEFGLQDQSGAMVVEVTPDTPAAAAGLREGDVIVELNGKKVTDRRHLRLMVSQTPPKTKIELKIIRESKTKTLHATLGELPAEAMAASRRGAPPEGPRDALEGVGVVDLDARARRQLNIPASVRGALVSEVDPDSAAAKAGLRTGDVLLEINRKAVTSADDAVELSEKVKGARVLLRIYRQGASLFLVVDNAAKR